MARVIVYGHSDDIISVSGDIEDEFSVRDDETKFLAFSEGTLLRVRYDGEWHISRHSAGSAAYARIESQGADDKDYSDVVTLEGDIRWIVAGERNRTTTS